MKSRRKPHDPLVQYGRNWQTPPPELPGKLVKEVVIGLRAGKRKKKGGNR